MKNTNRKDFHKSIQGKGKVKVTFRGMSETMPHANGLANRMSLWDMCEYMILTELQGWWNYNLDCDDLHKYDRKEKELMNECKIEFLN